MTRIVWPPRLPENYGEVERRRAATSTKRGKMLRAKSICCRREDYRLELFDKQDGLCHWCSGHMSMDRKRTTQNGRVKDNGSFATFEHLKPRHQGGGFNRDNIVLAHGSCNNKRDRRRYPHDPHPYGPQTHNLPRASTCCSGGSV